jgi:hypothetical protein
MPLVYSTLLHSPIKALLQHCPVLVRVLVMLMLLYFTSMHNTARLNGYCAVEPAQPWHAHAALGPAHQGPGPGHAL